MVGIKVLPEQPDDVKYFASASTALEWDPAIRARITVERAVIRKLVTTAIGQGYSVSVWDGEEAPVHKTKDVRAVMDNVCACDEEWIVLYHPKSTRKNNWVGEVYLVYGNDGPDVIADYNVSLETLLGEVCDYAETLYA